MSTHFAITTLIELAISILIVYCFMHEDKFIAFEQAVKRIVIGNIRRMIRIRRNSRQNTSQNKFNQRKNINSKQTEKSFLRAKF